MTKSCPRCGTNYPVDRLSACPVCIFEAENSHTMIGDTLELQEEIGHGGMGTVYKAQHLRLGRAVAIKFLPEHLAGEPEFQARFEREAKTLAMLSHPNIVTVYDFGQEENQHYIVMELVDGKPLSVMTKLSINSAIEIAIQVSNALSYAHRQGIVHRDIKPENILISADGQVKVTDFGIAKIVGLVERRSPVTAPNIVIGTPHYIAPEALAGSQPDPRMDIYSLGVVLYQMVTGVLPIGNFNPPPKPLDRIILKALAADPAKRYSSVEEMRSELFAISQRAPTTNTEELDPEEQNWIRAVAMLQAISTAVALWAFLLSVTPKIINAGEVSPLIMLGEKKLPDGQVISRARFEMWPTLGALIAFAIAITAYGLLRHHWRQGGLEKAQPNIRVRESRWVLICGIVACIVYGIRKLLESNGYMWTSTYIPILGGFIEIATLFFLWVSILQAWRISRPLYKEPLIWLGFALALIPPITEFSIYIRNWRLQ